MIIIVCDSRVGMGLFTIKGSGFSLTKGIGLRIGIGLTMELVLV